MVELAYYLVARRKHKKVAHLDEGLHAMPGRTSNQSHVLPSA